MSGIRLSQPYDLWTGGTCELLVHCVCICIAIYVYMYKYSFPRLILYYTTYTMLVLDQCQSSISKLHLPLLAVPAALCTLTAMGPDCYQTTRRRQQEAASYQPVTMDTAQTQLMNRVLVDIRFQRKGPAFCGLGTEHEGP